jgi:hypothetical protein
MWSNDYPHSNSTWPDSVKIVEAMLGHLEASLTDRIVRRNVSELYGLEPGEAA